MIRTVTYAGALASTNAIVTSHATSASPLTLSGAGLNGSIGAALNLLPRTVTITTTSHAGSYVDGSHVVVTGTDLNGATVSETLAIVGTDGGQTLVGVQGFISFTSIAMDAQADTSGAFTVGVRDVVFTGGPRPATIRVATTGNIKLGYADYSDVIKSLVVGEHVPCTPNKLYGDSSTTAQDITVFLSSFPVK